MSLELADVAHIACENPDGKKVLGLNNPGAARQVVLQNVRDDDGIDHREQLRDNTLMDVRCSAIDGSADQWSAKT